MIVINNVDLPLCTDFSNLRTTAAQLLKTDVNNIVSAKLYRKSVDARHKNNVHFCCSIAVSVSGNEEKYIKKIKNASLLSEREYEWKKCTAVPDIPPVVVGFGPAGMFAALVLARAGLKPIILERGSSVDERTRKVNEFFSGAPLDSECNVQFGEGGAGTFSDGKLTSGIKDFRCRTVIETFHSHGAPENILTDAKPHIGTDILVNVVKNIRNEIISLGGRVLFDTKLTELKIRQNKIVGIIANGREIPCERLLLCCGHSARDTFEMLKNNGVSMQKKAFAVGVRIEHLRSDIDTALYGDFAKSEYLSAADYKLAVHLENGRGVYTFCMCPGGEVINASSEKGAIAVNGMSLSARNGVNSNSAVLVGVTPDDFPGDDVLAGCRFQEKIEKAAYNAANGAVPVDTVGSFVYGRKTEIGKVKPTVKPGYKITDLNGIFPQFVCESLKEGIKQFGRKIVGFDSDGALLTAPETRSSSPVRILRDTAYESENLKGLYPSGEGAGYAGGIVSAAVDGLKTAEAVIASYETAEI